MIFILNDRYRNFKVGAAKKQPLTTEESTKLFADDKDGMCLLGLGWPRFCDCWFLELLRIGLIGGRS